MSDVPVPAWLADFQRGFGAVLRAPLDRSSGTRRASPPAYDPAVVAAVAGDAGARLAVYNRQYWCRLFQVMQGELPLVTALSGAWTFNDLAERFLLDHPPSSADLGRVADGFDDHLDACAPPDGIAPDGAAARLPSAALVQAARVDQAFRRVLSAPEEVAWRPGPADAARLGRCRLVPSAALSIVDEDWPLFELRHHLPREPAKRAVTLPPPHPGGRRSWAVCRARGGHRVLPLDPSQAALLRHLRVRPLPAALALLESDHPGEGPADLARRVQRWLAESMDLGLWTGLDEPGGAP